jgi:hypothetical protein
MSSDPATIAPDEPARYVEVDLAELAEKSNSDLIAGDLPTLLLDHDDDRARSTYVKMRPVVEQSHPFASAETYPSKNGAISGDHTHTIVKLVSPVEDMRERLFLQAVLGSDPKRELLSRYRLARNHPTPSVLFRPRAKKATPPVDPLNAVFDEVFK